MDSANSKGRTGWGDAEGLGPDARAAQAVSRRADRQAVDGVPHQRVPAEVAWNAPRHRWSGARRRARSTLHRDQASARSSAAANDDARARPHRPDGRARASSSRSSARRAAARARCCASSPACCATPAAACGSTARAVTGAQTELGIVFQSPVLLEWRNVLDNVLLQLELRGLDPQGLSWRARMSCSPRSASANSTTGARASSPAACASAPRSCAR